MRMTDEDLGWTFAFLAGVSATTRNDAMANECAALVDHVKALRELVARNLADLGTMGDAGAKFTRDAEALGIERRDADV